MPELAKSSRPPRPEFRNINALGDLTTYHWPIGAIVSIFHRVSGVLIFVLLPFVMWMFDASVSSEISFARFTSVFRDGAGFLPGWFIKLVALALIWAYLHHMLAGLRHVWMDANHEAINKKFGRNSAIAVVAISIVLTVALGAKLFGLY
jgi:succinate dehydrogenase / fumarate reductase cytochrome b subunit